MDRISSAEIAGWVADAADFDRRLTVHFLVDGVNVGVARADIVRADVEKAGRGPRQCGFSWSVPPAVAKVAIDEAKAIEIAIIDDGARAVLSRVTLQGDPSLTGTVRAAMRTALENAIVAASITALEGGGAAVQRREVGRYPLHERMFAKAEPGESGLQLSPYVTFTHARLRQEEKHPLDGSEVTSAAFLRWYIDHYMQDRRGLRAPLGAQEIAFLNAPLSLVGLSYKISRASLSYGLSESAGGLFPLTDFDSYRAFVTWWSAIKAPQLRVEDCLVPDFYIDVLRRVTPNWMGRRYAPSSFLEDRFNKNPRYHLLNLNVEADRILYLVWFLLEAVDEPGLIRFVPSKDLSALFAPLPEGGTLFDRIVQSAHDSGPALGDLFDAGTYSDLLWRRGFDLTRRRFIFHDALGNRFEAARFPPATAKPSERIPLQVVGPFEKSSGLGQASRLSAETIRLSGYDAHYVNFGLDNPAPVGMGGLPVSFSQPQPAQVNLLHLNGETIPIAFAYMRDVMNGAYNIGYFFWELSTPAIAQNLALELLDEIWVATEYGVSIYKAATDKPVFNVGMAIEALEVPDRHSSRAFLAERIPIGPETFVFFAAFDSFSFLERKNPHGLVEAFRTAFSEDDDVRLVLKTHNRDFVSDAHQAMRWERIVEIAASDPRIVIINETLQFSELMRLKKGADCYVSLHRSEGWGMGMVEAMMLGVPVVATGYSGNLDFTRPDTAWLVDYSLIEPRSNEYIYVERGQFWADPDLASAVKQLRAVRSDGAERERRVEAAREFVKENFSFDAEVVKYKTRLDAIFEMLGPA